MAKNNLPIIVQSHREHLFVGHRLQQGAANFPVVFAVEELTVAQVGPEINKAINNFVLTQMAKGKLADTWLVDQRATPGEVKQPGGCGGMGSLFLGFRQGAYL